MNNGVVCEAGCDQKRVYPILPPDVVNQRYSIATVAALSSDDLNNKSATLVSQIMEMEND